MRKELRPYQQKAVDTVIQDLGVDNTALIDSATGSGKTLINQRLAEHYVSQGFNVLCITSFAELVFQNSEEIIEQGGHCSVFCATLKSKKFRASTVVCTPQSLWSAIKGSHEVKDKVFNVVIIDEVHRVNISDPTTVYMKILHHYSLICPNMKIIGMSGSCMRGIDKPIYGDGQLFPKLNVSIKFSELVKMEFLVPPVFGKHDKDVEDFDFSNVKQNNLGVYDKKQVEMVVKDNTKTTKIIKDVLEHTLESYGVFIFCATIEQCKHVMDLLPEEQSRLITGTMNSKLRFEYLQDARDKKIKFLVNVNCLTTGINLPHYDTVVYLRLTESAIFFIQSIGRGSRLSPETHKKFFTVLDYAGNCEKFKDIGDKELATQLNKIDDDKPPVKLDIICPACTEPNSIYDRRCRGFSGEVRCSYMFVFRECPVCSNQCDVSAKVCPSCDYSLFDYNKHLSLSEYKDKPTVFKVLKMQIMAHKNWKTKRDIVKVTYLSDCDTTITEYFDPNGITWQQKLWKDFLIFSGMPEGARVPTELNHILSVTCQKIISAKKLEAVKQGKYWKIIARFR